MKRFTLLLAIIAFLFGNDKGHIYGKVVTTSGKEYVSAIRWGKAYGKEHFWMDSFNSNKIENEYEKFVDRRDLRRNRSRSFFGIRFNSDRNNLPNHQFEVYFGDLKKVIPMGRNSAEVILKNDVRIEVEGSDAGEEIYVFDEDGREVELKWRRIDYIEFMDTPSDLKYNFGNPLYGTVQTSIGSYTGLIQWDYDESLTNDELNGDDYDFEFSEIKSIEKSNSRRVNVVLNNGREYTMSGTNDVDRDNRGIVVKTKDLGTIEIKWREFESVEFSKNPSELMTYSDFKAPKKLYVKIELESGETKSGRIAFDLDETYDIEVIDGVDDDIEFSIPIRYVSMIENTGRDASKVTLRNGKMMRLYDQKDVSEDNDGVLLWTSENEDPVYYRWEDIISIKFD